jgi:hypothetical protein
MACCLTDDIQAGLFTIPELMCVVADLFEPEFAAEAGKKIIVGMCQRTGQIQSARSGRIVVPGSIIFSLRAAKATETLKVGHGW